MKVVHITSYDYGGAGLAALRIHQSLLDNGIESSVLVMHKTCTLDSVVQAEFCGFNTSWQPKNKYLAFAMRFFRHFNLFLTQKEKYDRKIDRIKHQVGYFDFASPLSSFDLSEHPLVKSADIIHIHWVAGFLDYPSFFSKVDKPIVWTFHDENICLGGFHYRRDKDKYCSLVADLEREFLDIKIKALAGKRTIHFVALSEMMKDYFLRENRYNIDELSVVHNSVNSNLFANIDKKNARDCLKVNQDSVVFAFCSMDISDSRKGLKELLSALGELQIPNAKLICIGNGKLPQETDIDVIQLGPIYHPALLSVVYSCADYFIMPSYQEAFAQTPLEAMSCGLPVIAFPCSGTLELINEKNGIRCDNFTKESLKNGIRTAMQRTYEAIEIRNDIKNRFSPETIAEQYIHLYNKIAIMQ